MSDRTVAFVGAGITVLAIVIVGFGLIRGFASTHPDSLTGQALIKLTG